MTDTDGAQPGMVVTKLEGRGPLNLLGRESFLALKTELDRLEQDRNIRAIILTGAGDRAFSAGVDLHHMKDLDPVEAESFITALHGLARKLLTMAIPARSSTNRSRAYPVSARWLPPCPHWSTANTW